jgi:hypothetical protein
VEKVDVSEARDLEALRHGAQIDRGEQELQNPREECVINFLTTNEGMLPTHPSGERDEVVRDARFDGLDQLVGDKSVKEVGCKTSEVGEVAMAMPALLLSAKQLDQNFRLPPGQLIHGISVRRKVDDAGLLDVVSVVDTDGAHGAESSFEPT